MVGLIKASSHFSDEDRNTIKSSIMELEKNTSGEIIPVVATTSGRYDRAEDLFGLTLSLISVSAGWFLFHNNDTADSWSSFDFNLTAILLTIFFSFIIGVLLTHLFPILRLPFITKKEMQEEVERAAAEAFHNYKLRNTEDSTGILIYISLYEHQVRVLGDDAISAKLSHEDWQHICDAIIKGCKENQITVGITDGINLAGKLLSDHFPGHNDDIDELANELITID
jgi:putative membrane protein